MTAADEAQRLALSTAIAQINAAIDALDGIDMSRMPHGVFALASDARRGADGAYRLASAILEDMKKQALDATPKEHR